MIPYLPKKYIKPLATIAVVAVVIIVAVVWVKCSRMSGPVIDVEVETPTEIAVTPQIIRSIKDIRQWEFLKITDEEVIDTVRKLPLWPDDRLVLVFHGTPRIGIDLSDAADGWVENHNDSLVVTLPQPCLLDNDFIDETLTDVFAQSGRWSAADRERLYESARSRMVARALTKENIDRVRRGATDKFTTLFQSLGAADVEIRFADQPKN